MKKLYQFLILIPIWLLICSSCAESRQCKERNRVMSLVIRGVVIKKYRDNKNHNIRTLVFENEEGKLEKTTLFRIEKNGIYDSILHGDTIQKRIGSIELEIARGAISSVYKLNFGCLDEHK